MSLEQLARASWATSMARPVEISEITTEPEEGGSPCSNWQLSGTRTQVPRNAAYVGFVIDFKSLGNSWSGCGEFLVRRVGSVGFSGVSEYVLYGFRLAASLLQCVCPHVTLDGWFVLTKRGYV